MTLRDWRAGEMLGIAAGPDGELLLYACQTAALLRWCDGEAEDAQYLDAALAALGAEAQLAENEDGLAANYGNFAALLEWVNARLIGEFDPHDMPAIHEVMLLGSQYQNFRSIRRGELPLRRQDRRGSRGAHPVARERVHGGEIWEINANPAPRLWRGAGCFHFLTPRSGTAGAGLPSGRGWWGRRGRGGARRPARCPPRDRWLSPTPARGRRKR